MGGIRAVLFDMGHTLVDFGPVPVEELFSEGIARAGEVLRAHGCPSPGSGRLRRAIGLAMRVAYLATFVTWREIDTRRVVSRALRRLGVEPSAEAMTEIIRASYAPFSREVRVLPGRSEMLAELSGRFRLGLVSNTVWPGRFHAEDLDRLGIGRYLATQVYSHDLGRRKPHAAPFLRALETLGAPPEEAVMVGDGAYSDIRGARRTGMRSILLADGPGPLIWRPDFHARGPDEVIDAVLRWNSREEARPNA